MRTVTVLLVVLLCTSGTARADLAGTLYDDVRDVVEELIQTEVTTSVVATVEARSPALAFYMHGTLERLASPYWGSLGRALKADLTVAVSDFVYWHISTGGGDGDVVASAKHFFGCVVRPGDVAGSSPDPACQRLIAAIHDQHRPLIEVECRRAKPAADRRVACDVGLAVLAALEQRSSVRHHVLDALGDIVLAEIDDRGLAERLRDVLAHWLDRPADAPAGLLDALGNPDLEALLSDEAIEKLCADPATIDGFLRDSGTSRGWICFAVTHSALPAALGAKVTIAEPAGKLDVWLDYWRIEAALAELDADKASDDLSFRLFADLAFDARCPAGAAIEAWPCKGTRLAPGATITVEWLGRQLVGTVDAGGQIHTKPNRQMMLWLLRFRKAIHRVEDLRALVPPSLATTLFYAGSTPKTARPVLRSVSRMARLVTELRARWYLWTQGAQGTSELDIAELLHAARDALGLMPATVATADTAKQSVIRALAFLDKNATGGASAIDIGDWLRLVMRGDYRSLAMESMRAALDVPLRSTDHPRETFFLTLSAYLLDTGEGVNESVARSAFRASAKDLLLSASHRGVPRAADRWRFRWLPRLSIRLSFNEAYAATGTDTRRTVVAADWPTAMIAITDYVGLEGSLLDPIAPLAELALRPAGAYHDQGYVALDAIRPRLGVWVAVPQLSRRLTLSVGAGARFVTVVRDAAAPDLAAHYAQQSSLTFDAGLQFVF